MHSYMLCFLFAKPYLFQNLMQIRETIVHKIEIVKCDFGHIYEKSKCTAHFALIFRLKFDALGVGTNNMIFTSRQMPKMWAWRVSSLSICPIVLF